MNIKEIRLKRNKLHNMKKPWLNIFTNELYNDYERKKYKYSFFFTTYDLIVLNY